MAHTPGPWRWHRFARNDDVSGAIVWVACPARNGVRACPDICQVYAIGDDGRPGGEMEANADLISAAPELLEACEQIVAGWGHQDGVSQAVELARAAIAKAKGGTA